MMAKKTSAKRAAKRPASQRPHVQRHVERNNRHSPVKKSSSPYSHAKGKAPPKSAVKAANHTKRTKKEAKREQKHVPQASITPPKVGRETQYPVQNDENELLVGTLHEPARPAKALVIVLHGFLGSRNDPLLRETCVALARSGIAAYRFDFSGNGDSEGRFEDAVPSKMLREVDTAVQRFRMRYAKVFLLGHSLGGTLAVLTAARTGVAGAIAIAAPSHLGKAAERMFTPQQRAQMRSIGFTLYNVRRTVGEIPYTITERFVQELVSVDPIAVAPSVRCPVLLVHGSANAIVPITDSEDLFEALPAREIALVGGADHFFRYPGHLDVLLDAVVRWVRKHAQ